MRQVLIFILAAVTCFGCTRPTQEQPPFSSEAISQVTATMTDLMVNDVTNPPLAARFFAYTCLAGYQVVAQHDSTLQPMHGVLNGFPEIEKPPVTAYSYQVSALLAMIETAKKLQPSGALMDAYERRFLDSCRTSGMDAEVVNNSLAYAQSISGQVLAYAKADKYNRISNYPRYTPKEEEGSWFPTPPGFFAPVEPYFNTIRPFTLDSSAQFKPAPPVAFSTDKQSDFYKLLLQVYEQGRNLSEEHHRIAAFWDCNPFALQDNGHLMTGMKKISPGAHWIGITGIACKQANKSFAEAMQINTLVAVALVDGFISCWDEKFRSNRIRPETAIRKYVDPTWEPLLQTPPFPEYLSGHSTVSAASAVILTHFFGDNFHYTDTVEERYGLEARQFSSFHQAAQEAAISRLYGGIHYQDAIDNGLEQGLQVGAWVLHKVEKVPNAEKVAQR
ncbi:vanadium-dependent haloperoxidase [Pontibacter liquoris]|uniref:vanadium-dependent haloperoxidase n=1 Tax=Pontibacter liquoris TaxID=2905677 RepID=UPI001FA6BA65|nr:vanadium-dependent haloperoxidase [Pontibacter liquoris]